MLIPPRWYTHYRCCVRVSHVVDGRSSSSCKPSDCPALPTTSGLTHTPAGCGQWLRSTPRAPSLGLFFFLPRGTASLTPDVYVSLRGSAWSRRLPFTAATRQRNTSCVQRDWTLTPDPMTLVPNHLGRCMRAWRHFQSPSCPACCECRPASPALSSSRWKPLPPPTHSPENHHQPPTPPLLHRTKQLSWGFQTGHCPCTAGSPLSQEFWLVTICSGWSSVSCYKWRLLGSC